MYIFVIILICNFTHPIIDKSVKHIIYCIKLHFIYEIRSVFFKTFIIKFLIMGKHRMLDGKQNYGTLCFKNLFHNFFRKLIYLLISHVFQRMEVYITKSNATFPEINQNFYHGISFFTSVLKPKANEIQ